MQTLLWVDYALALALAMALCRCMPTYLHFLLTLANNSKSAQRLR